jgi:hypothetical protein
MYVIVGIVLIGVMLARLVARLLGFKLKPWLPQSGRRRYFADVAISAALLLFLAIVLGIPASHRMAFGIAILAGLIGAALDAMRKRKPRQK